MADPFHAIQPTFAGGELSPLLYARVDLAKYATALKTARNSIIHPQGGWSNRSGFRYVAKAKYSDRPCRLISFQFSQTQSYMLEVGDFYIRFYKNGAQILISGIPYEISTPYAYADLPLLKWTQSADTLYLAHQKYPPQTLIRHGDTDWALSAFPFVHGPFMPQNTTGMSITTVITGGPIELMASSNLFNAAHVGSYWRLFFDIPSQSATYRFTAPSALGYGILCGGTYHIATTGTWTGTFTIEKSTDQVTWTAISQSFVSANDFNVNSSGTVLETCFLRLNCSALSSGTLNATLSSDAFSLASIFTISSYISPTIVTATLENPALLWVDTTSDWAEGSWSIYRGWPGVVGFDQDRLGWASSPAEPEAVWLSKTGNYVDHGVSDPLVDSDAVSSNLPSRKFNGVNNLLSMIKLLCLTASSEFSIGPGASGVLSPTSIEIKTQGYRGCSSVPAIVIGNQAVYIQPQGTVVRSISYQFYTDSFTGDSLSLYAEHLFKNYAITDLTYCQEPDSLAYAVRSDGQLLCMTYMPEQQIVAWTRNDTQGTFESCASIPTSNYDELWVVVNRTNGRFIERLAQRLPTTNTADQFHVDCGIDYNGAPATGISGLNHLEGMSVIALADGFVQGPYTVVSGSITLDVAASQVHIGLQYDADWELLNLEKQEQDGTGQGRRGRTVQVGFRFLNSLGGFCGPDSDHMHPIVPTPAASLGVAAPLFTGDSRQPIAPNWINNGRVFFRQSDPLPVTILGAFPITQSGNL